MPTWLVVVLASLLAIGGRAALTQWIGDGMPFVFAYAAVITVALLRGFAPALATGLASAPWVSLGWVPPHRARPLDRARLHGGDDRAERGRGTRPVTVRIP